MSVVFNNAFECYDAIGQWLTDGVPEPWEEIAVEFEIIVIDDVSEDVIDYLPSEGFFRKRKQFFINDTGFAECFFALAKLTSTPEKGLFKKCRYVLKKDGRYRADFEYSTP